MVMWNQLDQTSLLYVFVSYVLDLFTAQNVREVAFRIRADQKKRPINLFMVWELLIANCSTVVFVFDFFPTFMIFL